jgi:ankyrin repeat protein
MTRSLCIAVAIVTLAPAACQRDPEALKHAVSRGDVHEVRRLLDDGVMVDTEDGGGFTALHQAVRLRHVPISRLLVERGADVNAAAIYGVTPLHLTKDVDTAALLLSRGARLDVWAKSRGSPLHSAIHRGSTEVARLMVAEGAPLDSRDRYSSTPLHMAAGTGNEDMVALLIVSGASMNARNDQGYTPLHWAARNGHVGVVELLMANEASVNATSDTGDSALDMALDQGHERVARALERAGAKRR